MHTHTHTHTRSLLLGVVMLAATAGLSGRAALGDLRRYEFRLLGTLGSGGEGESIAYAINELGEIAGEATVEVSSNEEWRAAVWLYCPRFGLSAQVFHDVSALWSILTSGL